MFRRHLAEVRSRSSSRIVAIERRMCHDEFPFLGSRGERRTFWGCGVGRRSSADGSLSCWPWLEHSHCSLPSGAPPPAPETSAGGHPPLGFPGDDGLQRADEPDRRSLRGRRPCLRRGEERLDQGLRQPARIPPRPRSPISQTNVHNFWDRGLLGMALHPNFPTTPYVYVLYTYDHGSDRRAPPPRWGDSRARTRRARPATAASSADASRACRRPGT